MDWSDFYVETCSSQPSAKESQNVFVAITNLWIQFSNFEISLHQFKKAVEVFEKAIIDPICCKSLKIYQAYAQFCIDRKKLANAQNVYIKGLCAGLSELDNNLLWSDFLSLMHFVNKSTDLTVADLYDAVKDQKGVEGIVAVPAELRSDKKMLIDDDALVDIAAQQLVGLDSQGSLDFNESKENDTLPSPQQTHSSQAIGADTAAATAAHQEGGVETSSVAIKMEVEDDSAQAGSSAPASTTATAAGTVGVPEQQPHPQDPSQQEPAPQQEEERRYAAPDDLDDVSGMTPEQIIRTYTARPPMLFTALHKVKHINHSTV